MGIGKRPALIEILCNNKIASHEDCRRHPCLPPEAEIYSTPAVTPTGIKRSVRETHAAQPGIAEVPLCGMRTPIDELQQHLKSEVTAQGEPQLSYLQHCGTNGHHSNSGQASALPFIEQKRVDDVHSAQTCRPGPKKRVRIRQLGARSSNTKAAEQHAPSVPDLQTCGQSRTGNGAMQQSQQLQTSSSLRKLRQYSDHPSLRRPCKRPVKQQKVGMLPRLWSPPHVSTRAIVEAQALVEIAITALVIMESKKGRTGCAGPGPGSWAERQTPACPTESANSNPRTLHRGAQQL